MKDIWDSHRPILRDLQLALYYWNPGATSRHELDKTYASGTSPGSSLPSQPHVQPLQGTWVHWPLRNCCLKALGMSHLNEEHCKTHNLYCDFYRRAACILQCLLLHAHPVDLCTAIAPRGELMRTRAGTAKELCTQHQPRNLPCTADLRFSLMSQWEFESFLSPDLILLH